MLALSLSSVALAAHPMHHGWDTVGDMMGMHGKWSAKTVDAAAVQKGMEWAGAHYSMITTGTDCHGWVNATNTIEDSVRAAVAPAKKNNPNTRYGMYWRTDFALELAQCSDHSTTWNTHAAEWTVKADNGKPLSEAYIDFTVPAAADFFAKVMLDTLADGTLDYIYMDGVGETTNVHFRGGAVSKQRGAAIILAKHNMVQSIQEQLDAKGKGQNLYLNGCDNAEVEQQFVSTGAAGVMFDHWSILQYIIRGPNSTGKWNTTLMDQAFKLATSAVGANISMQIKGWPGPIARQKDQYPAKGPVTPKTPAEQAQVAAARFNNELALFLLVASERHFWIYSWFWGFYDYIPGDPTSSIPKDFFPQSKCELGPPKGPYKHKAGTLTYTREFEHASVFVDLADREACKVTFDAAC